MQCPECERPWSDADRPVAGGNVDTTAERDAMVRCNKCLRPYADAGAALLHLLTRLANCGLTAEAPTVLTGVESGS